MDLRVTVFQHGRNSFLLTLREHQIEFAELPIEPGSIRASGELFMLLEVAIPAVAQVLVAWLQTRPKGKGPERKIILRSGTKSIQIEGYSVEDVERILGGAASEDTETEIVVIQTCKDDE